MDDKTFLKKQRKAMLLITITWFLIIGSVFFYCGLHTGASISEAIALAVSFGLLPPLGSTLLNWNDTSRYS